MFCRYSRLNGRYLRQIIVMWVMSCCQQLLTLGKEIKKNLRKIAKKKMYLTLWKEIKTWEKKHKKIIVNCKEKSV